MLLVDQLLLDEQLAVELASGPLLREDLSFTKVNIEHFQGDWA